MTAPIGHNRSPIDALTDAIEDLFKLASDTLAGGEVTTDEQDAAIDGIMDEARKLGTAADKQRATEKQPHLDAGRAVDAQYKPLTDKAKAIAEHCKQALTPYRAAKQRAKDDAARKAREEANARQKAAQDALRQSEDLEAKFAAEEELKQAQKLTAAANRIDREATGLRTYFEAEITDCRAAIPHYMHRNPERFRALVQQMADEDARGDRGVVPGVVFHERKKAA